jgi:flavin reductase (DIM6/NTAB) family NADH-FMN oxidoreductase RutF
MKKILLKPGVVNFPMPVALVGSEVNGKMNFMTVAWISMASYAPPKIVVTLGDHHETNKGIKANGVFSVNFPSTSQAVSTDYCGIVSAAKTDKSGLFAFFFGTSPKAPMIEEFPLCVECTLDKIVVNGRYE